MAQTPPTTSAVRTFRQGILVDQDGNAIVKTIQIDKAAEATPSAVLQNRTGYDYQNIEVRQHVFIKPRLRANLNPMENAERRYAHDNNTVQRGGDRLPGTELQEYVITRTWLDEHKITQNPHLTLATKKQIEAEQYKLYQLKGIRPLRVFEVEIAPVNGKQTYGVQTHESIYHIAELAMASTIHTEFFNLNESVFYKTKNLGNVMYKEGSIVGFYANGDVVVKSTSHHLLRVKPEDVFNKDRGYKGYLQTFRPNEEAILRYERPASNLTTDEAAKVVGVNPTGEVLLYFKKLNSLMRVSVEDQFPDPNRPDLPAKVRKSPMSCSKYFG